MFNGNLGPLKAHLVDEKAAMLSHAVTCVTSPRPPTTGMTNYSRVSLPSARKTTRSAAFTLVAPSKEPGDEGTDVGPVCSTLTFPLHTWPLLLLLILSRSLYVSTHVNAQKGVTYAFLVWHFEFK